MHNKFIQLFWALTAPITGALGWIRLSLIALKEDPSEWRQSFSNRKVLIVGSGPSLDKVDDKYFKSFDSIIYINHAIKCAGKVYDEYFFSTDVNVVKGIQKKDYFKFIEGFGQIRSILSPIFFQQTLWVSTKFLNSFGWLKASHTAYKVHWTNGRLKIPVTSVLWPVQPNVDALEAWFSQKHQASFFPVFETTSALSAIVFASKYQPQSVTLIGCDFGIGRAKDIEDDCPGHKVNIFGGSAERFEYIKSFLAKKNIVLKNDSWAAKTL